MSTTAKMDRLVALFGSGLDIAAAACVTPSTVSNWRAGRYQPRPEIKAKIIKKAKKLGLDQDEVASLLGIERCECCGCPTDRAIRDALK